LNAVPERAESDKSKAPLISRLEKRRRHNPDYHPDMPAIEAPHLIGYLLEVGPVMESGPITHQELFAWQANTGVKLQPWEIRMLRQLSCDYLSESHKAMKPDCSPPWNPDKKPAVSEAQAALRRLASL
jgi:hypothetical protein